jgi:hypothetical protein
LPLSPCRQQDATGTSFTLKQSPYGSVLCIKPTVSGGMRTLVAELLDGWSKQAVERARSGCIARPSDPFRDVCPGKTIDHLPPTTDVNRNRLISFRQLTGKNYGRGWTVYMWATCWLLASVWSGIDRKAAPAPRLQQRLRHCCGNKLLRPSADEKSLVPPTLTYHTQSTGRGCRPTVRNEVVASCRSGTDLTRRVLPSDPLRWLTYTAICK